MSIRLKFSIAKPCVVAFLLLYMIKVEAQEGMRESLGIKASYYGAFVMHPGLSVGIDYPIAVGEKIVLHWDSEMGYYRHRWNTNSTFVQTSLGSRYTTNFSGFVDLNVAAGYALDTPSGDIYSYDGSGNFSEDGRPWFSSFKPSFSLMLGWDGNHKKQSPWLIQGGLEAFWQRPVNQQTLPGAAIRLGVIYRLKNSAI